MGDNYDILLRQIQDMGPGAEGRIKSGFARSTTLTPEGEGRYREAMRWKGHERELNDPTYDNRAAWQAGMLNPTGQHGWSLFKGLGDERLMLHLRGNEESPEGPLIDTRTMGAPDPRLVDLWRVISGTFKK